MSNRELPKNLIDRIPENRLYYVVAYLQGAAVPDDTPNAETVQAIQDAHNGVGLSRGFSSVAQLMEDLNADD
jgi:hypothetical protein